MSNGHWTDGFTAFFVAIVICWAVVATGLFLERYESKPCPVNPQACDKYEKSKRVVPFGHQGETKEAKEKSYRDEYRSEQDLIAQQNMANWAWWLMIVSWLSFVALVFAVFFAYTASKWARTGAHAATRSERTTKDIGQAQVRAYVAPIEPRLIVARDQHTALSVKFRNTGQTPAFQIIVKCKTPPHGAASTFGATGNYEGTLVGALAAGEGSESVQVPVSNSIKHLPDWSAGSVEFNTVLRVKWINIFGDEEVLECLYMVRVWRTQSEKNDQTTSVRSLGMYFTHAGE